MCSTISPRYLPRTTSFKTTFRLLFKDSNKWRRSPDTNRFAVEVGSSRCCTRRTGRVSLDRPGSRKWTSSFFGTRYCAAGRTLLTSTAKPTACTAGCELVQHNGHVLGTTASDFWRMDAAAFLAQNGFAATALRCFPYEAHFWYQSDHGLWWLGKISGSTTTKGVYLVRFFYDLGPIKLPLPPARYTTSTGALRGSWCLQVHLASAFSRGVQRNVDESRDTAVHS